MGRSKQNDSAMRTSQIRSTQRGTVKAIILLLLALFGWPNLTAAQTYTLAPSPHLFALDASGNIINAGCIWTYLTGTSTLATTYTTSSGTANANPILASSSGQFVAFLQPGTVYRFVYEAIPCSASSHGSVLATRDGIAAVPVSGLNVDVSGTAGETLTLADLVYLSATDGSWYRADADATATSTTAVEVGFATAAASSAASVTVRIAGRMTGLSLTAGEIYYASATAAGLTATPPTNARCIGKADSTTTLILPCDDAGTRLPDSDGTHSLVVKTTSDLTADRLLTIVPGDAARTVTLSGNLTVTADATIPVAVRFKPPQGRCSLTTALPVTVADVTAATTLYYALYGGNNVTLYNGSSAWVDVTIAQLSIAVPATTATVYDVFIDYTAGVPALEVVAWTNGTTRATALAIQDGVYVQTADTDSLYVCTFRTTGVSGQTEDSVLNRLVWNYYNRVPRALQVIDTTDTWDYTTATWRQAGASAANQVAVVVGVAEVSVGLSLDAVFSNTNASIKGTVGVGYDSTSTIIAGPRQTSQTATTLFNPIHSAITHAPAVGYHYYSWNEYSEATGTTTWYGDAGAAFIQSGMTGTLSGG